MENTCVFFFLQTGGEGCAFGVAFGGMEGREEGGRGGAHSACFSRFLNVILRGGCPPFFGGDFSLGFFVFRKNAHTLAHLPSFCGFRDHFCGCLCTFRCLFSVFWRSRHFVWALLTQFGAFFLGLGTQGHNVLKPVSQGTLNVRFERIQGSPLGPFRMHFCSFFRFCDFAETVLPCRRQYLLASLGGARPSLFTHGPPLKKQLCEKGL